MRKYLKSIIIFTLILLAPFLINGCGGGGSSSSSNSGAAKTSAKVVFATADSMDQLAITKCTLTITSTNSALVMPLPVDLYALYKSSGTTSITIPDLKAGEEYAFTILAYDAANTLIYSGVSTQALQAGSNNLSILVSPIATGSNSYYPVAVGYNWKYNVTPAVGALYTRVSTITQTTSAGYNSTTKSDNGQPDFKYTYVYDNNAIKLSSIDAGIVTTYTPASILFPSSTAINTTESTTSTYSTNTLTRTVVVNGMESVTVPAGSFNALKITTTITTTPASGAPTQNISVDWYANNVGKVKSILYPATNPSSITLSELTLFSTTAVVPPPAAWKSIGTAPMGSAYAMAIDPGNNQIIYVGTSSTGIYKTTDGGINWSTASSGIPAVTKIATLAVDPSNTQVVYAGTAGGVFKTTNGGTTWTSVKSGTILSLVMSQTNSQVLFAGTQFGVSKTVDGGSNWADVNTGLPSADVQSLVMDPNNGLTLYAGCYFNGIYKTTNGGITWTAFNTGISNIGTSSFYAISIDPTNSQVLYAGKSGSIMKSTNGGTSWSDVSVGPTAKSLVVDPTNAQIVYAGIPGGGVSKSINGGATWSYVNSGIVDKTINGIVMDLVSSKTLYTVGNGIYKTTTGGV